ncbi:hypothetical protein [Methylococcus sp. Mc7]|uniref:hypothetical protein n=1 Tax=Methylococcus sp. Mc7 TaxID=2860258 RepID=UPI001C52D553|nr:hypothetical protein [Methylococcus sp. Mc7]QXP85116.1 hypothetical protein KW115_05105 [Methylococcus sp. Mc7]
MSHWQPDGPYHDLPPQADIETKAILKRCITARAVQEYRALDQHPPNTRTAEEVCTQVKGVKMTVRRTPGTALANDATGEVVHTPIDTLGRHHEQPH